MLYAIEKRLSSCINQPVLVALVLAVTTANVATAAEFIPLGTLPGHVRSNAYGISDDGRVVVGQSYPIFENWSTYESLTFRWTDHGMASVGKFPGVEIMGIPGNGYQPMSADGSVIVGTAYDDDAVWNNRTAFIYSTSQGLKRLDDGLPASDLKAHGISSDGTFVIGSLTHFNPTDGFYVKEEAFRYKESEGYLSLGQLGDSNETIASDITADGKIIVGTARRMRVTEYGGARPDSDFEIFKWTEASGMLGTGISPSQAQLKVTDDGEMIAGTANISSPEFEEAFYWTEETGTVSLGWLPHRPGETGDRNSAVRDMTPDGRLIVGWSGLGGFDVRPFVWTPDGGMEDFEAVLREQHGLADDFADWELLSIQGVSSNGQFFTGYGYNPAGDTEGWVVRLDAPWGTQPIPEPTTAAIAILALVPLAVWRTRRAVPTLAVLVLAVATANLATAAEFIPLGTLPGHGRSYAYGVSDDGKVVAGTSRPDTGTVTEAFRWTEATGMVGLGLLPGHTHRSGAGWNGHQPLSGDGRSVVGTSEGVAREAFLYNENDGMMSLGGLESFAFDVSYDGQVVVGTLDSFGRAPEAFRWSKEDGLKGLGTLTRDEWSMATDVSADGETIIGFSWSGERDWTEAEIFRWSSEKGMEGTGLIVADPCCIPTAVVSNGGERIAGTTFVSSDTSTEAFYWTQETGVVGLGWLPAQPGEVGALESATRDMTPDGRLIVGWSGLGGFDVRPFVWTPDGGMEDFEAVLQEQHGLADDFADWELTSIQGVSSNGQFFTGYGYNPAGEFEAWLVRLDAPWGTQPVPEPAGILLGFLAVSSLAVFRRVI